MRKKLLGLGMVVAAGIALTTYTQLITHGKKDAQEAFAASAKQFGPADVDGSIETSSDITEISDADSDIPSVTLSRDELKQGYWVVKLFSDAGLVSSNGEARRLIKQGGLYIEDSRIETPDMNIDESFLKDESLMLRSGKKKYKKVVFQ